MADIYDVQNALASLAQTAIYPNGIGNPSIVNTDVRIFPGWPIPDTLDADLTARKVQVSIFPADIARVSTRFDTEWYTTVLNPATLIMTIEGLNEIAISGTVSVPQACMVLMNGEAYSYGVQANDTLNSIAANLASIIPNSTASGAVVTLNRNPSNLRTSVIVTGTSVRELAREKRMMIVTVWAPSPLVRSQIANALNVLFSSTYRVALPDGFYGQLSYNGSREIDVLEKVKCYRRDLHFIFEYAITQAETDYTIGTTIISEAEVLPINFTLLNGDDFTLIDGSDFTIYPILPLPPAANCTLLNGNNFTLLDGNNFNLLGS